MASAPVPPSHVQQPRLPVGMNPIRPQAPPQAPIPPPSGRGDMASQPVSQMRMGQQAPVQQLPVQQAPRPGPPPQPNAAQAAPAPNNQAPPQVLRDRQPRHGVQISDLRRDNMSEADAREALSSIVVIRMEKAYSPNDLDREGKPRLPTWDRVARTEETDVSQHVAVRSVKRLDKTSPDIARKKRDLPTAVQRQIEKTQEFLEDEDPDSRYSYVLIQLDSKFQRIEKTNPLYDTYCSEKALDQCYAKKKKKNTKKSKCKAGLFDFVWIEPCRRPKKLERVTVTTYFRRAPRQEVDAMKMFKEKEKQKFKGQPSVLQTPRPPGHPPSAPAPAQPLGQANPSNVNNTPRVPHPTPVAAPPATPSKPPAKPVDAGTPTPPVAQTPGANRASPRRPQFSRASSSSSVGSDSDSTWTNNRSDYTTAESSIGSIPRTNFYAGGARHRRRHAYRPEAFGLGARRRHTRSDGDRPSPISPPSTQMSACLGTALPSPTIDAMTRRAYREGVGDAVASFHPLVVQREYPRICRPIRGCATSRSSHDDRVDAIGERFERTYITDDRELRRRSYDRNRDHIFDQLGYDDDVRFNDRCCGRTTLSEGRCEPRYPWAPPAPRTYAQVRVGRGYRSRPDSPGAFRRCHREGF